MTQTDFGRQSEVHDAASGKRQAAGAASGNASDIAGQAAGFASKAASAIANEAQHKASGLVQQQMEAGADYVHMVSQTAHKAAREMEDKAPEFARMVHDVADRADRFADDLREKTVDEVLNAAWDFARRNPRMFLGGAVAAGFLLTRFAKSSAERSAAMTSNPSYRAPPTSRASASGAGGMRSEARETKSLSATSGGAPYAG